MPKIAVYPGSFDPVTLGHLSVLERAANLFDELHVLVVHNPAKTPMFSSAKRVELMKLSLRGGHSAWPKITFGTQDSGLLADYCLKVGATAIVKGFRTAADIEYELPMAQVNRDLAGVETVFLPAEAGYGFVSSSLVKQVASLSGDVSKYVSDSVAEALAGQAEAK